MAKFDETCINSGSITMNDYRRLVSCAASHHTVQVRWFCIVMQLLFWPETTSMFTLPCKDSIFSTITMDYMTAHERESCSLSQLCLRWLTVFLSLRHCHVWKGAGRSLPLDQVYSIHDGTTVSIFTSFFVKACNSKLSIMNKKWIKTYENILDLSYGFKV